MIWAITSTISLTIKSCCRKVPFLWSLFRQHKAQLCSELTNLPQGWERTVLGAMTVVSKTFHSQMITNTTAVSDFKLKSALKLHFHTHEQHLAQVFSRFSGTEKLASLTRMNIRWSTLWTQCLKQQQHNSTVGVMRLPLAEQYFPRISLGFTCIWQVAKLLK